MTWWYCKLPLKIITVASSNIWNYRYHIFVISRLMICRIKLWSFHATMKSNSIDKLFIFFCNSIFADNLIWHLIPLNLTCIQLSCKVTLTNTKISVQSTFFCCATIKTEKSNVEQNIQNTFQTNCLCTISLFDLVAQLL